MNMYRRLVFPFLLATTVVLTSFEVLAEDSERHQIVDGLEIYLGVLPAELVSDPAALHEGKQRKRHRYHVLVALFDSKSGERITDVRVKAQVAPVEFSGIKKVLEPMYDEAARSYGNYFRLPKPGRYRIGLEIRLPGVEGVTKADFIYRRPRD